MPRLRYSKKPETVGQLVRMDPKTFAALDAAAMQCEISREAYVRKLIENDVGVIGKIGWQANGVERRRRKAARKNAE